MIEQDYFMRMVSMMAQMLASIITLKKQKDYPRALLEIETTARTLLGLDQSLLRQFSAAQITDLLGTDPGLAIPRAYGLGLLLKEEAEIRALMGEESEADFLRVKSLDLLAGAWLREGKAMTPDHAAHIDDLLEKLAACSLPPELLMKIMAFHESTGRFDRAENVLYDIIAATPDFAPEGLLFYRRLLLRSDEELERGNLPRQEVLDGIADLKTR